MQIITVIKIANNPDKKTDGNILFCFPHLKETVKIENPNAEITPPMLPFIELFPKLSINITKIPRKAIKIAKKVYKDSFSPKK